MIFDRKGHIYINAQDISDAWWPRMITETEVEVNRRGSSRMLDYDESEGLREFSKVQTGSVSMATMEALEHVVAYFKPEVTVEVGTYIGRSTRVLQRHTKTKLYTVDATNNFSLNLPTKRCQVDYRNITSGELLKDMPTNHVDLFFYDGRIQSPEEAADVLRVSTENGVVVLDDCAMFEKGTMNAMVLCTMKGSKRMFLPPPTGAKHRLGLVIPNHLLLLGQE